MYSKISITHKVGNPNLQIHLIVNNIGGRKVRVKGITASITKDGELITTLPAQNYLESQSGQNTLLFTPFSLNPSEEWAHIINLLNFFNREDEQEYRRLEAKMLANYRSKKVHLIQNLKTLSKLMKILFNHFIVSLINISSGERESTN